MLKTVTFICRAVVAAVCFLNNLWDFRFEKERCALPVRTIAELQNVYVLLRLSTNMQGFLTKYTQSWCFNWVYRDRESFILL